MSGTILGIYNGKAIVQPTSSRPNRNVLVVGGPGSFKTQSYVLTNVVNETENSLVVTDPKGEVYEQTAEIKRRQGYEIHMINFTNMTTSDRHNPLDYVRKDNEANVVANKIVEAANRDGKRDVWFLSQRALLKALILYATHELEPKKRNIGGIIEFLQSYSTQNDETGSSDLDRAFESLDFNHPARRAYELGYKKARGDMQGSIIVSLLSTIADYIDDEVSTFTSFSDFHLKDIGRKKIALYVIIPVMDTTWEGLINIFFQQLFDQLYELGAENNAKLPKEITFILDEFVNLGKFEQYESFLATCRGYGIGVSTIIQSITQLQDRYGEKKAESILGNKAVKICLNASNDTTAKYFSNLLGDTTVKIDTESRSTNKGKESTSNTSGENESYVKRSLMTPQEVANMPEDTSIILFSNRNPVKAKKAFQFKVFPNLIGSEGLTTSQILYRNSPAPSQLEAFEVREREFKAKMLGIAEAKQQAEQLQQEDEEREQAENEAAMAAFFYNKPNEIEDEPINEVVVEDDLPEIDEPNLDDIPDEQQQSQQSIIAYLNAHTEDEPDSEKP